MRADVAKLLLLDEPFKGVSPAEASRMLAALGAQARATGQVCMEQAYYCSIFLQCLIVSRQPPPLTRRAPSLAALEGCEDLRW